MGLQTLTLRPDQIEGVKYLTSRSRSLLGDEPGLGKTAQLIRSAQGKTLVVAPAMVLAAGVWTDEINLWAPDLDATLVPYSSIVVRQRGEKGGSVPTGVLKPELSRRWDTVIFDEAHHLKGRKTTWALAGQQVRANRYLLATGTPIPNWAHELFMLLRILHPESTHHRHFWPWAKTWFDCRPTPFSPMVVGGLLPHLTWDQFYQKNLDGVYIARQRDQVLRDLPPLTRQQWLVPMKPKQKTVYNQLRREFVAWLESGEQIIAWTKSALTQQLRKAATGLEVLGRQRASGKFDALREILDGRSRPVFLACFFRDTAAALDRLCKELNIPTITMTGETPASTRGQLIRRFQDGEGQVLVATVDAVKEGVPITRADTVVLVEKSYSPYVNEQVIRRVHRNGQTNPVLLIELISQDTSDERVEQLLTTKTDHQIQALSPAMLKQLF